MDDGTVSSASFGHDVGHEWSLSGKDGVVFQQILSSPKETLNLSVHRTTEKERERYTLTSYSTVPPGGSGGNQLSQNHYFTTNELGIDYKNFVSADETIKLGYRLSRDDDNFDNAGSSADPVAGTLASDPSLNNQFRYRQTFDAVYGSYQRELDGWQILTGLRAEHSSGGNQLTSNQIS